MIYLDHHLDYLENEVSENYHLAGHRSTDANISANVESLPWFSTE